MKIISLDEIDIKRVLADKTLNSTDKVLFVWMSIELVSHSKCSYTRYKNYYIDKKRCSEETGIHISCIDYILKKLEKYILILTITKKK